MTFPEPPAFHEAIAAQQQASDPAVSAFVDANAGAGKTAVLTARVARLLLAGAEPSKILCITYTKAAAAEMAERLLKLLGAWALADDALLRGELDKVEGPGKTRSTDDFKRARSLFARALEAPGGLKIQTIHSFCESVLQRFPLETGAAPGFSVIDEKEALALARDAVNAVNARAAEDGALGAALALIAASLDPDKLGDLLVGQILSRQKIEDAVAAAGGWTPLREGAPARFDVAPAETAKSIRAAAAAAISDFEIARLRAALRDGGKTCREAADALGAALTAPSPEGRFYALAEAFLTAAGAPRAHMPDKSVKGAHPWTEQACATLAENLSLAAGRACAADNCADTIAFLTLLEAASARYQRLKQARAGLDYDDLIARTRDLFRNSSADWVRYKLDQGVDHILLDEGQDTSPAQWQVIEGPLKEFFAGDGARETLRTFFAVGDKKQSIYSFQGADAELFEEKRVNLGKDIAAVRRSRDVPLRLSFRSAAPVLEFVDQLFADPEAIQGVGEHPLRHELRRVGAAGRVELWPLTPKEDQDKKSAWDAPLDAVPENNPRRKLAIALARDIKRRVGAEILPSRGRLLRARDFLILAQSRSALFHETIRALAREGVAVAGADKIRLLEEPAVEDVLSYARAVLLYSDDLAVAETLRSPFFSISEDGLYELAFERTGSLRGALRRRAGERPEWAQADAAIARAEIVGREEGAFAFIAHLLEEGEPSGRKRLYARLSPSAEEPLNELLRQALDYEQRHPRSLQGFVNWAERNAGEIKRDPDQAGDAARVMTVHGAKGLEAEVVILLDAHKPPNLSQLGPLFYEGPRNAALPIISTSAKSESALASAARALAKRRAYDEYRRLLYVAATRARDQLIVCGVESGNTKDPGKKPIAEKTWHALAVDAMERLHARTDRAAPSGGGGIRVHDCAQEVAPEKSDPPAAIESAPPPAWLFAPAAPEARARATPSALGGAQAEGPAYSPLAPDERLIRGKTLHRLIELLPQVAEERRVAVADKLLARHAPRLGTEERARWRAEALAVVGDAAFAPVFAPGSRAEIAIAGMIATKSGGKFVSGQIDRLALDGDRLLIVDYKTNRPPPKRLADVAPAYVAQLAAYRSLLRDIYPSARLEAALLWTYEARLMAVPAEMLDEAFERLVAAA